MEKQCGIYRIYCRKNKKYYVGSSLWIANRWSQHRYRLNTGTHPSPYLQNAWNKYGESAFTFKVLEECSKEQLPFREQHWIDTLKPAFNSVQVTPRREWSEEMKDKLRGRKQTPEVIAKRVASNRTSWPDGKPHNFEQFLAAAHTPEVRAKIGVAHKGKVRKTHCVNGHERTPENIAAGSLSCKQCAKNRERAKAGYDASWTDEQIAAARDQKISAALTGKHNSDEHKAATGAGVRAWWATQIRATACPSGHLYDERSLVDRKCRICAALRSVEYYKARRR